MKSRRLKGITVELNFIRIVREREREREREMAKNSGFIRSFSDKRETEMAKKSGWTSDK
jgi:hypothetical protein